MSQSFWWIFRYQRNDQFTSDLLLNYSLQSQRSAWHRFGLSLLRDCPCYDCQNGNYHKSVMTFLTLILNSILLLTVRMYTYRQKNISLFTEEKDIRFSRTNWKSDRVFRWLSHNTHTHTRAHACMHGTHKQTAWYLLEDEARKRAEGESAAFANFHVGGGRASLSRLSVSH